MCRSRNAFKTIWSVCMKIDAAPFAPTQPLTPSHGHFDPHPRRRPLRRAWRVASRRTAEGLPRRQRLGITIEDTFPRPAPILEGWARKCGTRRRGTWNRKKMGETWNLRCLIVGRATQCFYIQGHATGQIYLY